MNRRRRLLLAAAALAAPLPPARAFTQAEGAAAAHPLKVALVVGRVRATDRDLQGRLLRWFGEEGFPAGRLELKVHLVDGFGEGEGLGRQAQADRVMEANPDLLLVPGIVRLHLFSKRPPRMRLVFADASEDAAQAFMADSREHGPGGVTGTAGRIPQDMVGKSWEHLRQLVPGLRRIGDLHARDGGVIEPEFRIQRIGHASVARKIGVDYRAITVSERDPFAIVAGAIRESGADGLGVSGLLGGWDDALLSHVAAARIPAVYDDPAMVRRGGLLSFRHKDHECFRHAVRICALVLRGEAPSTIPVHVVLAAHVAVNLRTAAAMRLRVPVAVLARADEVVR